MAKQHHISSTEKLLDLIRNDSSGTPDPGPGGPDLPSPEKLNSKKNFFTPGRARGLVTVGVDIGFHDIKLIKTVQVSEQNIQLLAYAAITFAAEADRTSDRFPFFLGRELRKFCGADRKVALWSTVSAANVEVRQLQVPRVPRKQLADTVAWAFKKDLPLDEQRVIFDFEVLGETTDKGVKKTRVLACTAPRSEVAEIKELFAKSGYPLTGITIAPFALQNLFRTNWIAADAGRVVCHLYIGRNWSRIDIFSQGQLVLIRGIKTGINSMAEDLVEGLKERLATAPANEPPVADQQGLSLSLVDDSRDAVDSPTRNPTLEEACRILYSMNAEAAPLNQQEPGAGLSEAEVFAIIQPAMERLLRQIERTFEHYDSISPNTPVEKIYIAGKIDTYQHLVRHIGGQLGLPCATIDPFAPSPAVRKGAAHPRTVRERVSYTLAMGLALANNSRTPNFLHTYKQKKAQARALLFERGVLLTFLVLALVCGSLFCWQIFAGKAKNTRLDQLNRQLSQYNMTLDRGFLRQVTVRIKAKKEQMREYSHRYLGMAVLNELSGLTPERISLFSASCLLGPPSATAGRENTPATGKRKKNLIINGLIRGDRQLLDSALAGYLARLATSPLFGRPALQRSSIDAYQGAIVLNFTLSVEIL
ncbi:MAG: pilus assembly protein PilM [Desulfobacterales bacterium]|nr:pilus assembly protein PilM [Desulfobacterales bacterium]